MNLLQVQAQSGLRVPMEDKPRTHITDTETVSVPDSAYYQRRLADGDLVLVPDQVAVVDAPLADDGGADQPAAQLGAVADAPLADDTGTDQTAAQVGKKPSKAAFINKSGA